MKKILRQARWALAAILPVWPIYYLSHQLLAHRSGPAFDVIVVMCVALGCWVYLCLANLFSES